MSRLVGTAIFLTMLLTGCSQKQSIGPEELKSDASELTSIAAEASLFASFVAHGQATNAYVKGHAEYLRDQCKDLRKELDNKSTDPSLQTALATLQKLSQQLNDTLTALPDTPDGPRWHQLATEFARIARISQAVRPSP